MRTETSIVPVEGTADTIVEWGEHGAALRTAGGAFLGLSGYPEGLARGERTDEQAESFMPRLAAERAQDALKIRRARWPEPRHVILLGDAALAADVQTALAAWGAPVARLGAAEAAERADAHTLVIGVAEAPAGRAGWDRLDDAARRGAGWIRAYREDGLYLVDPLAVGDRGPTAAQVLARRRATSNAPRAWQAWRNATTAAAEPPGPADPAARAHQLSRILALSAAWARGTAGPDETNLLQRYDAAEARLSRHRALAFDPPPATALSAGAVE